MDQVAIDLLNQIEERKKEKEMGIKKARTFREVNLQGELQKHYDRTLELFDVDYKVFIQQNKVGHPDAKRTLEVMLERLNTVCELFDKVNK
jgi:hypothetical protein